MTSPAEGAHPFEQAWTPVPGPVNRTTFFAGQARNRRATWRLSALCFLAVILTGLVLSLVLAPPLYGATLLGLALAKHYGVIPPALWQTLVQTGSMFVSVVQHFTDNKPLPSPDILWIAAALVLLPGILVQILLWLGIRAMFLRAGAGGVLLTLGARPPRTEDLKEKKLVDVVEEMAIAGGVHSPKVMLLDSRVANAAVVGSSSEDATLVVSRGLLDELDRDQLQAVVAHLIASAGNGDLRIAMAMVSVYQTTGLLTTMVNAPFGPHARHALWRLLRMAFRRGGAGEADEVSEWLTTGLQTGARDDLEIRMQKEQQKIGCIGQTVSMTLLPVFFFNFSLKVTMWVFSSLLFEPAAALMWRTRCYLADACAVQLTRNPDGLAQALQHLAEIGGLIHGGKWASHLFVVGQEAGGMPPEMAKRLQAIRAQQGGQITRDQMIVVAQEVMMQTDPSAPETAQAARKETLEEATGAGTVSFHPPLEKRLKRLQALGAHYAAGGSAHRTPAQKALLALVMLISSPLILLVVWLLLAVVIMCIGLNLVFVGVAFAIILSLVRLIP